MSKPDTWMPLYIGDYLQDTTRLSTEQHGAYMLLIMDYWSNGPLPDDDDALAHVTRLSLANWKKHRQTMARFFRTENGHWYHKRIESELGKASQFIAKQKANGAKGGRPKTKPDVNPNESQEKPMGYVRDNPNHNPNESPSPTPSPTHKTGKSSGVSEPSLRAESPSAEPPDHLAARAIEITALLRQRGAALQAADPKVRAWAERGVTDAQALSALELAQQRRHDQNDPKPVNAGYLDAILSAEATPNGRAPPGKNGAARESLEEKNRRALADWKPPELRESAT